MKSRSCFILIIAAFMPLVACAEINQDWGGRMIVGAKAGLTKKLDVSAAVSYSLQDKFSATDKYKFIADISYRIFRNKAKTFSLKTLLGYEYVKEYMPEKQKIKDKGTITDFEDNEYQEYNLIDTDAWWNSSHRVKFALSGKVEFSRFTVSVREMYRYSHSMPVDVNQSKSKFRYSEITNKVELDSVLYEVERKGNSNEHLLRSRLQIEYNIPHCKADPFIMAEIFNNVASGFRLERMRYRAGFDMTFAKRHGVSVYYQLQNYIGNKLLHTPVIEYTYEL